MPTVIQPGFTSGEWSPYLEDRTDLEKYRAGCITLENFLLMSFGPVRRRPGTQHIGAAAATSYPSRLFRFQFSAKVGYVVEIGESLMWFYRDRLRIVGLTAAHPYLRAQFKDLHTAQINDLEWFVHGDHPVSKLTRGIGASITSGTPTSGSRYRIDGNTGADFTSMGASVNTLGTSFIADGGTPTWGTDGKLTLKGVVLSAGTPVLGTEYSITANAGADFTTSGAADSDVGTIFIANGVAPTWGTGEIQSVPWNFAEIDYKDPPFREENLDDAHTLGVDAYTGTGITITANTDTFDPLHVGAYWRIGHHREVSSVRVRTNPDNNGAVSPVLQVSGGWEVVTQGVWYGRVDLMRSVDGGTFQVFRQWNAQGSRNFTASGNEISRAVRYRLDWHHSGSTESNGSYPAAYLELSTSLHWGVVKITGVTSELIATADVIQDLYYDAVTVDPTELWAEGSWSDFRGYPKTVTLHEQRMVFGGNAAEAQTIWGSDVDAYDTFTQRDNNDSDSFQYVLGSDEYNEIQWLATSPKNLMVGTTGGEWSFSSGSEETLITPTNVRARRESVWGAEHVQALSTNNVILFVEQGARKLRELAYSFEQDGFVSADLAQLSEHLTSGGIVDMAIQRHRDVVIWCVTGDGNLLSLTYDRSQNVVGWAKHTTQGSFESVEVINTGGEEDEVWFCIKRTINGSVVRHIESFYPDMWRLQENETQAELFHVDDGAIVALADLTSGGTVASGLSHLATETVQVLNDGAVEPEQAVVSDTVTTKNPVTDKVIIGLGYTSTLEPLAWETSTEEGTSQGRSKRIHESVVNIYKSGAFKVGTDSSQDRVYTRDTSDPMDAAPPLKTQQFCKPLPGKHTKRAKIRVTQEDPLPLTVISIAAKYRVIGD